jgi:hypothetical protein
VLESGGHAESARRGQGGERCDHDSACGIHEVMTQPQSYEVLVGLPW